MPIPPSVSQRRVPKSTLRIFFCVIVLFVYKYSHSRNSPTRETPPRVELSAVRKGTLRLPVCRSLLTRSTPICRSFSTYSTPCMQGGTLWCSTLALSLFVQLLLRFLRDKSESRPPNSCECACARVLLAVLAVELKVPALLADRHEHIMRTLLHDPAPVHYSNLVGVADC